MPAIKNDYIYDRISDVRQYGDLRKWRYLEKTDFLLIGGGIMSASLGTWLQELQPEWKQVMVEKLDGVALESSNGWNNAGTGHSAIWN